MEKHFCQSCYMPMNADKDFGTEKGGTPSENYCCHCYADGAFTSEMTYEEAVEANIPFWRTEGKTDDDARAAIQSVFPKLMRWKTS